MLAFMRATAPRIINHRRSYFSVAVRGYTSGLYSPSGEDIMSLSIKVLQAVMAVDSLWVTESLRMLQEKGAKEKRVVTDIITKLGG